MDSEMKSLLLVFSGILIVLIGIWVVASHFEAAAYNRITGANVSTFDAMFVELRVHEGAKP